MHPIEVPKKAVPAGSWSWYRVAANAASVPRIAKIPSGLRLLCGFKRGSITIDQHARHGHQDFGQNSTLACYGDHRCVHGVIHRVIPCVGFNVA